MFLLDAILETRHIDLETIIETEANMPFPKSSI